MGEEPGGEDDIELTNSSSDLTEKTRNSISWYLDIWTSIMSLKADVRLEYSDSQTGFSSCNITVLRLRYFTHTQEYQCWRPPLIWLLEDRKKENVFYGLSSVRCFIFYNFSKTVIASQAD